MKALLQLGLAVCAALVISAGAARANDLCASYPEGDKRMPERVRAYLAKHPVIRGEARNPKLPRIVQACNAGPGKVAYLLVTSPVFDVVGVCRIIRFQLNPADVGGNVDLRQLGITNLYRQTAVVSMQMARSCPPQGDPGYVPARGMTGGTFAMLMSFWKDAVRSPERLQQVFSGARSSERGGKLLARMAEVLKAGPDRLKLSGLEFSDYNLREAGKLVYTLRVSFEAGLGDDPATLTFGFDILKGRVTPIFVDDLGP